MPAQLADLSEHELLDELEVLHRTQLETGVQPLRLVAEFARQHGEATVDLVQAKLPGRELTPRSAGRVSDTHRPTERTDLPRVDG